MSTAEAVGSMAEKLTTVMAERDRLRDDLSRRVTDLEAERDRLQVIADERDRLRAVVDAARAYVELIDGWRATTREDIQAALAELRVQLRRAEVADQRERVARDQLDVSGEDQVSNPLSRLALEGVQNLVAERDRLRAVVRRAQEAWTKHVEHDHDDEPDVSLDEWVAAWDALRALDVSGNIGDE